MKNRLMRLAGAMAIAILLIGCMLACSKHQAQRKSLSSNSEAQTAPTNSTANSTTDERPQQNPLPVPPAKPAYNANEVPTDFRGKTADSDNDEINDRDEMKMFKERDVLVNEKGRAMDDDKDGIPIPVPLEEVEEEVLTDTYSTPDEQEVLDIEPQVVEEPRKEVAKKELETQLWTIQQKVKEMENAERRSEADRQRMEQDLKRVEALAKLKAEREQQASEVERLKKELEIVRRQEEEKKLANKPVEPIGREDYAHIEENHFTSPLSEPLSTFSIDVDKASYANTRRYLNGGSLPPAGAVRIEELVNYFHYDYRQPFSSQPFAFHTEASSCPWNSDHQLVHIGLKGREIDRSEMPASNLVFLIDVSGSMNNSNKLPLLKQAFSLLIDNLNGRDRVAIVVYAGAAGVVLPSTSAAQKGKILNALNSLGAGGSTAGGAGIQLAYQIARNHFIQDGNNRVILATDGDFNVGPSSESALIELIEGKRKEGVFLSVLGFGTGNYQDRRMEQLADHGNGNYAYIDNLQEAQKVLVNEMGGTLHAIAKDVKIQIEFNPTYVKAYRLIGYENRKMAAQDFNDDTKDAGELGAGHTVTALYEIVPHSANTPVAGIDPLKYQQITPTNLSTGAELMTIKFRYKEPTGTQSKLLSEVVKVSETTLSATSENHRFAASVAAFGMLLRGSRYSGEADYDMVYQMARQALGKDYYGYRNEFLNLIQRAKQLDRRTAITKN